MRRGPPLLSLPFSLQIPWRELVRSLSLSIELPPNFLYS